jgi:MFS transporter, OFA family, oxalate/formate antiporter
LKKSIQQIPFNPAKFPFFYGWIVLAFGTIGMLMSVPGQTVGVSVFTDFLIDELRIPRNFLSLAYMAGTIGSALLMTRAGKLYDRVGARWLGLGISVLLGLILVYLSFAREITETLRRVFPGAGIISIPFLVMTAGFFLVRFAGQGSLTLLSRNMVMEWFEKRRGFANAILGIAVSFGFSYSPRLLDRLIQRFTWQGAWRFLAVVIGGGFAFLVFLFFRNQPEDHGLVPDGNKEIKIRKTHAEVTAARPFPLQEARKTYSFWIFTLSLLMSALIVTAATFHVVSIFASRDLPRAEAVGIFLPSSFVAVAFQFVGSYVSDYIKMKYVLLVQLAGLILLCFGIIFLRAGTPEIIIIAGLGVNQGLFGVTGNVTWARFFGRKHLGAVSGFATAWIVAGSAVGPYLFSIAYESTGTYTIAALISAAVLIVLFFAAWKADRPK